MAVSTTDQVLRVSFSVNPLRRWTTQKPLSFIHESVIEPNPDGEKDVRLVVTQGVTVTDYGGHEPDPGDHGYGSRALGDADEGGHTPSQQNVGNIEFLGNCPD